MTNSKPAANGEAHQQWLADRVVEPEILLGNRPPDRRFRQGEISVMAYNTLNAPLSTLALSASPDRCLGCSNMALTARQRTAGNHRNEHCEPPQNCPIPHA